MLSNIIYIEGSARLLQIDVLSYKPTEIYKAWAAEQGVICFLQST